jgi:hypothetical protein
VPANIRRLSLLPIAALLATGVCACGSTSSGTATTTATAPTGATGATVIGTRTTIIVNADTAATLKRDSIKVTAVAPAAVKHHVELFLPETGGQVVAATFTGAIEHSGGLTISYSGKSVTMTNLVVDTKGQVVTATIDGQTVPVFSLDLNSMRVKEHPHGAVVASHVTLTVTPQAASLLNSQLGVTTFAGTTDFGTAVFSVALKS